MEVPQALRNKYISPSEPLPPSTTEKLSIASNLVEKSDDDPEIKRILAEADVFVKYGLIDRAADHLRRVFERVPTHAGAHERLAAVLVQLGRSAEASAEYETLAQQFIASKPAAAAEYARKALELNPSARRALEVLGMVAGSIPAEPEPETDSEMSSEIPLGTPEPEVIESGEIELLSEAVESDEFGSSTSSGTNVTQGASGHVDSEPPADDDLGGLASATRAAAAPVPELEAQAFEEGVGEPLNLRESNTADSPASDAMLADLEQVDFFIDQGLVDEATGILDELEARVPGHALLAKRREKLAALAASAAPQGALPAQVHSDSTHARRAPGLANAVPRAPTRRTGSPTTTAVGEHDVDTHADLGIMEKTMERYEAAIEHFKAVLADPKREVFALSMIGECAEALGDSAEAIRCYQDALKRPTATAAEATQLYFQLGNVFYNMGDHSEALYYFERVFKRDPNFRDIQRRLGEVKPRGGAR
jgi:tetratricopeptide (TPR) repeat protein